MKLHQKRQEMRNRIRKLRHAITDKQQRLFAKQIIKRAWEQAEVQQGKRIALYLSFDGELDTQPLITYLWEQGKLLYLPAVHPCVPGKLLFIKYDKQTKLIKNRFNILEPYCDIGAVIPFNQLNVLFTPLVAFDANGKRLGMGKGFYDRTLKHWQQQRAPYPIGLAHDCQKVNSIPSEVWDVSLPKILTPSSLYQ